MGGVQAGPTPMRTRSDEVAGPGGARAHPQVPLTELLPMEHELEMHDAGTPGAERPLNWDFASLNFEERPA